MHTITILPSTASSMHRPQISVYRPVCECLLKISSSLNAYGSSTYRNVSYPLLYNEEVTPYILDDSFIYDIENCCKHGYTTKLEIKLGKDNLDIFMAESE